MAHTPLVGDLTHHAAGVGCSRLLSEMQTSTSCTNWMQHSDE
jgi:hypothetical protein